MILLSPRKYLVNTVEIIKDKRFQHFTFRSKVAVAACCTLGDDMVCFHSAESRRKADAS